MGETREIAIASRAFFRSMITAILTTLLIAPAPAAAPAPASASTDAADASARVSATEYIYNDEDVSGEKLSPTGVRVGGPRAAALESMIKVRGTFLDRLHHHALDM